MSNDALELPAPFGRRSSTRWRYRACYVTVIQTNMDLTLAHQDLINTTWSGFTFLLANGIGWIVIGALAFKLPEKKIALLLLLIGLVTMPLAFGLRFALGLPDYNPDNPLNRIGLLLAFVPAAAFPAILIAYFKLPKYMPCIVAAILGGHFLPYSWLYQSNVYLFLGISISLVPPLLLLYLKKYGYPLGPLFVGIMLLIGSVLLIV